MSNVLVDIIILFISMLLTIVGYKHKITFLIQFSVLASMWFIYYLIKDVLVVLS